MTRLSLKQQQIGMSVVRDELDGTLETSSDEDKSWGQNNKKAIDVQKYKTRICKYVIFSNFTSI